MHDISVIIAMNRRAERSHNVYRMAHDGRGHARLVRVIHTSPRCRAIQDHAECTCAAADDQRYSNYKRTILQETTDPKTCQPCHGTGTVELGDQPAQCVDCQGTGRPLTGPGPLDPDNEAPNPTNLPEKRQRRSWVTGARIAIHVKSPKKGKGNDDVILHVEDAVIYNEPDYYVKLTPTEAQEIGEELIRCADLANSHRC